MRKLLGTILIAAAALSARFPDFVKWGAVQGKDQVLHAKLEL